MPLTRRSLVSAAFTLAGALAACSSSDGRGSTAPPPDTTAGDTRYHNPVLNVDFPDPAVLRAPDGEFYAYATQTVRDGRGINIQVAHSRDLVSWVLLGDALPQRPSWATRVWHVWAPHVVYDAPTQRYVMYYAAHDDALDGKCVAIALASAPRGPFVDVGAPLVCARDGFNIDPMAFDDPATGRHYLYWGSSGSQPIVVQELAADRLSFAPGSVPHAVVYPQRDADYQRLVEGPWVVARDGWYYVFYSGDDCCGAPPHYAVLVARSRDPLGPFQRLGEANGTGHSEVLSARDDWEAPGHNAIVTDDAATDWIVYHAIDPARRRQDEQDFVRRPMLIDRITWRDGWPTVAGGTPSRAPTDRPVIVPRP